MKDPLETVIKVLEALYELEDKTGYKRKNISIAVDAIRREVNYLQKLKNKEL